MRTPHSAVRYRQPNWAAPTVFIVGRLVPWRRKVKASCGFQHTQRANSSQRAARAIAIDLDKLIRVTENRHANEGARCAMVAEASHNFVRCDNVLVTTAGGYEDGRLENLTHLSATLFRRSQQIKGPPRLRGAMPQAARL